MTVKVLWIPEHAEHEPVCLFLLHGKDVWVQARARPDGLLEESPELAEAWAVRPMGVPQAAIPTHTDSTEAQLQLSGGGGRD